jgi:hypothetical protein
MYLFCIYQMLPKKYLLCAKKTSVCTYLLIIILLLCFMRYTHENYFILSTIILMLKLFQQALTFLLARGPLKL